MKTIIGTFVAAVVGVGIGSGIAWSGMRKHAWNGEAASVVAPVRPSIHGQAKVSVDQEEFDFGTIDSGTEGTHDFIFTNKGTLPLTLVTGMTSCRCTVSSVEQKEIAPGQSGKVTVKWKSKEVVGVYRQSARIDTNDPDHPEVTLIVSGEIAVGVRSIPPEIILNGLSTEGSSTAEARVFSYIHGTDLKILDFKLSDPDLAKFFKVTHEPLPKEELSKEKRATSGVLLRVKSKPGLPHGPFQQTILLATNIESDPSLAIPLRGNVKSDIVLAGPGWDADRGVLDLGAVDSRTGAERRLLLIVRGPHANEVKFAPVLVDPDVLQVTVGETVAVGSGTASQTPLVVRIPERSHSASHLGGEEGKLGRILLDTGHPRVPQLRIMVRFAIEGGP